MFYKWGGSDILSISTFNQIFKDTQSCRCYPVAKKNTGFPIPKTLSKYTNIVLEMFLKNDFFLKNKNAP